MSIREGAPVKVTYHLPGGGQPMIYAGTFIKQYSTYFTIKTDEGELAFNNKAKVEVLK